MSAVLYAMTLDDNFLLAYIVLDSVDECSDDGDGAAEARGLDHFLALISDTAHHLKYGGCYPLTL